MRTERQEWDRTYYEGDRVRSLISPPGNDFGGEVVEGSQGTVIDQPTPDLVSVLFDGHTQYVYMRMEQIAMLNDESTS